MRKSTLYLFGVLALVGCPDPHPSRPPWTVVASDLDEAIMAIGGSSSRDVWAVGADRGQGPLALHFDGQSWARIATDTEGDLWWVHVLPDRTAYVGGDRGIILYYDGSRFVRMRTPGLAKQTVFGIWAFSRDNVYAVGAAAGRAGFVWHYDGSDWTSLRLPDDLPRRSDGEVPGLFKVFGDSAGNAWIVGGSGTVLRVDGSRLVDASIDTSSTIFTIHGSGDTLVAVGGDARGAIWRRGATASWTDDSPSGARLFQGVCLDAPDHGWAVGQGGEIYYQQRGSDWRADSSAPSIFAESLHAVWVDPDGGVWAVGGNVISARLDAGVIVHRGPSVAPYQPSTPWSDAGADAVIPPPLCPNRELIEDAEHSIARRWNEQILAAVRLDIPNPGVHARNLFHLSVAMYDAWAAYDESADGYSFTEKASSADPEAARQEAISYAAYRVLTHRYRNANGGERSLQCMRELMEQLGYDPDDELATGDSPRAIGNRIGQLVVEENRDDGANEEGRYADPDGPVRPNPRLIVDEPGVGPSPIDVAHWQPLNLAVQVTQNGITLGGGDQSYIGSHWGAVRPFAMTRANSDALYFDPGPAPTTVAPLRETALEVAQRTAWLDVEDDTLMEIGPAGHGNNPLGTDDGSGYASNPVTGQPYASDWVPRSDFGRVLAEFWADGPHSETPPGHWNVLANEVADSPFFDRRWRGQGATIDPLEWDIKVYFALNGAVHDAAIAAWQIKRNYLSSRPITLIRWMAERGQSSEPSGPDYSADGLPLIDGFIERITPESSAIGERHAHLAPYVGELAIRGYRGEPSDPRGEIGGIAWIRALEWIPYQRRTFVTPSFPGYISGHSTFSRAAAEVLALLTGSEYFPGGIGEFVARQNEFLIFEEGPSRDIHLQWATYFDASDQAGQSRLWGGIHISPDDFQGRIIGSEIGRDAAALALTYFDGSARAN